MSDIEIHRKAATKKAAKAAPAKKTPAAKSSARSGQPDQRLSDVRIEQEIQRAQSAIDELQQQIAALEELRRDRVGATKTVAKVPKAKAAKKATVKKAKPPRVRFTPKKK